MAWLVQSLGAFIHPQDQSATKAHLVGQLERQGIPAERSETTPLIVARCVTLCLNLGLWRCWSERLEFRLEEVGPSQTRVTINAVPSLLRLGVKSGERVVDPAALISALQRS